MWKKIEPLVAGFWMGGMLAYNPWWVNTVFMLIVGLVAFDKGLRALRIYSIPQLKEQWPSRYRWLRRQVRGLV